MRRRGVIRRSARNGRLRTSPRSKRAPRVRPARSWSVVFRSEIRFGGETAPPPASRAHGGRHVRQPTRIVGEGRKPGSRAGGPPLFAAVPADAGPERAGSALSAAHGSHLGALSPDDESAAGTNSTRRGARGLLPLRLSFPARDDVRLLQAVDKGIELELGHVPALAGRRRGSCGHSFAGVHLGQGPDRAAGLAREFGLTLLSGAGSPRRFCPVAATRSFCSLESRWPSAGRSGRVRSSRAGARPVPHSLRATGQDRHVVGLALLQAAEEMAQRSGTTAHRGGARAHRVRRLDQHPPRAAPPLLGRTGPW